jgi:CheY-like chemotaxis protein
MMEQILLVTILLLLGNSSNKPWKKQPLSVVFVRTAAEAIAFAGRTLFGLAIIDAEVEDTPMVELVEALRAACPGIKFIMIPLDNRSGVSSISSLPIHGYLMKPFYLPDLLEMVGGALPAEVTGTVTQKSDTILADDLSIYENSDSIPTWLDDPKRTAQLLTSLALESAAQGILVLKDTELWAYAVNAQPTAEKSRLFQT